MAIEINFLDILTSSITSREWAILFWLLVGFFLAVRNKEIRASFGNVVKAFFHYKIIFILLLTTIYILVLFFSLNIIHLLKIELIKDYLYWYFGFAILSLFSINIYKHSGDVVKNILKEIIKASIIIEFLVNFYTFPFLVELLFIPFIFFLYTLIAYTEIRKEYEIVRKLLNIISMILGLIILTYIGYGVFNSSEELFTYTNLLSTISPILLSLLFIPWLYLINLFMVYEELFVRIGFLLRNTPQLITQLKLKIFLRCHFNLYKLNSFKEDIRLPLLHIKTQEDVNKLFRK